MSQRTRRYSYDFRGHCLFPLAASGVGTPWVIADTSAAGAPTIKGANLGGVALTLAATNEVENICLYHGDVLPFDIDDLISFEVIAKVSGTLDAGTTMVFGLGSARNDTPDTVTANAWFRLQGSNDVLVETDDNVTDNDDIATGVTLSTTFKRFLIDFGTGIQTRNPPALALGGKSNIQFFGGNANGQLRRLASGTLFDMAGYSVGLQPIFQVQKTATTAVDALTILECHVEVKLPAA